MVSNSETGVSQDPESIRVVVKPGTYGTHQVTRVIDKYAVCYTTGPYSISCIPRGIK